LLSFKSNLFFAIGSKELFRILMFLLKLPSRDTLVSNTTAKKILPNQMKEHFPHWHQQGHAKKKAKLSP
jgi:hypothetical protein